MTLYEISADYAALMEMAQQDDVDPIALQDTFYAIDGTFEDKAENYAKMIASIDAESAAIADEIKRLQARKTTLENTTERLKASLMKAMVVTGKTKFKTPLYSFGIVKNPAGVQLIEGEKIPKKYLIPQEPKVDKKAILEQLKAGKKFKWATLTQGERVSIR